MFDISLENSSDQADKFSAKSLKYVTYAEEVNTR